MNKKPAVKKMAMGGPVITPARGNAAGAMRGLDRAAAMSGRGMPTPGVGAATAAGRRPAGYKAGGTVKKPAKGK